MNCRKCSTGRWRSILAGVVLGGPILFAVAAASAEQSSIKSYAGALHDLRRVAGLLAQEMKVSAGSGIDSAPGGPGRMSLDTLFLLDEVETLSQVPGRVDTSAKARIQAACAIGPADRVYRQADVVPSDLDLSDLGRPACMAALLMEERRLWRRAAEIGIRAYGRGLEALLARLAAPKLSEDAREGDVAADLLGAWWRKAGIGALEAVARVGREWMKQREGEDAEAVALHIVAALERLLAEPAVQQLRNAVRRDRLKGLGVGVGAALSDALEEAGDRSAGTRRRLDAVERFAVGYARATMHAFREVLERVVKGADCLELVAEAPEGLFGGEEGCSKALTLVLERLTEVEGSDNGSDEAPGQVAALTAALEERVVTLRLLVAKGSAVPEVGNCSAALRHMAGTNEMLTGTLNGERIARAATGLARTLDVCVDTASAEVLHAVCNAKSDAVLDGELQNAAAAWETVRAEVAVDDAVDGDAEIGCEAAAAGGDRTVLSGAGEAAGRDLDARLESARAFALARIRTELTRIPAKGEVRPRLDLVFGLIDIDRWNEESRLALALCDAFGELQGTDVSYPIVAEAARMIFAGLDISEVVISDARGEQSKVAILPPFCSALVEATRNGAPELDVEAFMVAFAPAAERAVQEAIAGSARSEALSRFAFSKDMLATMENRSKRLLVALEQDAERYAARAERAVAALSAALALDKLTPFTERKPPCTAKQGASVAPIGFGLSLEAPAASFETDAAGAAFFRLEASVAVSVCGAPADVGPTGGTGLTAVKTLIEDTVRYEASIALDRELTPAGVERELRGELQRAAKSIAVSGKEAVGKLDLEALRAVLLSAGFDRATLAVLNRAGFGGEDQSEDWAFSAAEGLIATFRLALPKIDEKEFAPISVCLRIPIGDEGREAGGSVGSVGSGEPVSDCFTLARLDEVPSWLASEILERMGPEIPLGLPIQLDPARGRLAGVGGERDETVEDAGVEIGFIRDRLRLRVPAEVLRRMSGGSVRGSDTPSIGGALKGALVVDIHLGRGNGSGQVVVVEPPGIDVHAVLASRFEALGIDSDGRARGDFFVVAPLPLSVKRRSEEVQDRCGTTPVAARITLGDKAPLQGVLGTICLPVESDATLIYVPPREGVLQTRSRDLRFEFTPHAAAGANGSDVVAIRLKVAGLPAPFETVTDAFLQLHVNLNNGQWEIPPDAGDNRRLYRKLEMAASDFLPRGIRIRNLSVSERGIRFSLDAAKAGERLLSEVPQLTSEDWMDLSAVVTTSCKAALLYALVDMIRTGENVDTDAHLPQWVDLCSGSGKVGQGGYGRDGSGLKGWVGLSQGETPRLTWECSEMSGGGTGQQEKLRQCRFEIYAPDQFGVCDDSIRFKVDWPHGSKAPRFSRSKDLMKCLKKKAAALLPDDAEAYVEIRFGERLTLVGECLERGGTGRRVPESCGVALEIEFDVSKLIERSGEALKEVTQRGLPESNGAFEGLAELAEEHSCKYLGQDDLLEARAVVSLDGRVRIEGFDEEFLHDSAGKLRRCLEAIGRHATEKMIRETLAKGGDARDHFDDAAAKIAHGLESFRKAGTFDSCKLRMRQAGKALDCAELAGDGLRSDSVAAIHFTKNTELFEETFGVILEIGWDELDIDPISVAMGEWDEEFENLMNYVEPRLRVSCPEESGNNCAGRLDRYADGVAKRLVEILPKEYVTYDGGATLHLRDDVLTFMAPLEVTIKPIGVSAPIEIRCGIRIDTEYRIVYDEACNQEQGVRSALLVLAAEGLEKVLPHEPISLEILQIELSDEVEADAERQAFRLEGEAKVLGLEDLKDVSVPLTLLAFLDGKIEIEADFDELVNLLGKNARDAVNDFVGDFAPIEISKVTVHEKNEYGVPVGFAIESVAKIADIFKISAPRVVLGKNGFSIDGPKHFEIGFASGVSIPIEPVVICPTGGEISDEELVVRANITLADCSAKDLVDYKGSLSINLDEPGIVTMDGALTLLRVVPLGSNRGELNLRRPALSQEAEIGGAIADVIALDAEFLLSGSPFAASAASEMRVFRTPIGKGDFYLNLPEGRLDTNLKVDLGFAKGAGTIRTGHGLSKPQAAASVDMEIAGVPIVEGDLSARPRHVNAGISVFGLVGISVGFPGLDALNPDEIRKAIWRWLTPNYKDLGKALEALMSGNARINLFARLGGGGDGLGGDDDDNETGGNGNDRGDGGREEGGPNDPGNGLAMDAPAPKVASKQAESQDVDAVIGSTSVVLRFVSDGDRISIRTGAAGSSEDRLVAIVAKRHAGHFASGSEGIRPRGRTLSVSDTTYGQILTASISGMWEGCDGKQGSVVHLYTGTDTPRGGFYELCRLSVEKGAGDQPATEELLGTLPAEHKGLLAAFHEVLAAELASRPAGVDDADDRLVLKARLFDDVERGMRGVIGIQRAGQAVIAAAARIGDSECGAPPASGLASEYAGPKVFILTGLRGSDLSAEQESRIVESIRALWGCEDSPMGRIDLESETQTLVTMSSLSTFEKGALVRKAKLDPPDTDDGQHHGWIPQWLREALERARAQAATQAVSLEEKRLREAMKDSVDPIPTICLEGCSSAGWEITEEDGHCFIKIDGERSGRFRGGELGPQGCNVGPSFVALGADTGGHVAAIVATTTSGDWPKATLGIMTPDADLAKTRPLSTGSASEPLTPASLRVLIPFGNALGRKPDHRERISQANFVRAGDTHAAATIPVVTDQVDMEKWYYATPAGSGVLSLSGRASALGGKWREELLRALPQDAARVEVFENATIAIQHDEFDTVLRWDNGRWWEIATLLRGAATREERDDALRHLASDGALELLDPGVHRRGRIISLKDGKGAISGYVLAGLEGATDRLWLKRAESSEGRVVLVDESVSGTIQQRGEPDWFVLRVRKGQTVQVTARKSNSGNPIKDPFLCVFAPTGRLVGFDDDGLGSNLDAILNVRSNDDGRLFFSVAGYSHDMVGDYALEVKAVENMERIGHKVFSWPGLKDELASSHCVFDPRQDENAPRVAFSSVGVNGIGSHLRDAEFIAEVAATAIQEPEGTKIRVVSTGGGRFLTITSQVGESPDVRMALLAWNGDDHYFRNTAMFGGDLPPDHALPELARELMIPLGKSMIHEITGEIVDLRVPDIHDVWSTMLPDDEAAGRRTIFFDAGGTRRVSLLSGAEGSRLDKLAIGHAIEWERSVVTVLDADKRLVLGRSAQCPSDVERCAAEIVALDEVGKVVAVAPFGREDAANDDPVVAAAVALFEELHDDGLLAPVPASGKSGLRIFDGAWNEDSANAAILRFSEDTSYLVVAPGGGLFCLGAGVIGIDRVWLKRLARGWPWSGKAAGARGTDDTGRSLTKNVAETMGLDGETDGSCKHTPDALRFFRRGDRGYLLGGGATTVLRFAAWLGKATASIQSASSSEALGADLAVVFGEALIDTVADGRRAREHTLRGIDVGNPTGSDGWALAIFGEMRDRTLPVRRVAETWALGHRLRAHAPAAQGAEPERDEGKGGAACALSRIHVDIELPDELPETLWAARREAAGKLAAHLASAGRCAVAFQRSVIITPRKVGEDRTAPVWRIWLKADGVAGARRSVVTASAVSAALPSESSESQPNGQARRRTTLDRNEEADLERMSTFLGHAELAALGNETTLIEVDRRLVPRHSRSQEKHRQALGRFLVSVGGVVWPDSGKSSLPSGGGGPLRFDCLDSGCDTVISTVSEHRYLAIGLAGNCNAPPVADVSFLDAKRTADLEDTSRVEGRHGFEAAHGFEETRRRLVAGGIAGVLARECDGNGLTPFQAIVSDRTQRAVAARSPKGSVLMSEGGSTWRTIGELPVFQVDETLEEAIRGVVLRRILAKGEPFEAAVLQAPGDGKPRTAFAAIDFSLKSAESREWVTLAVSGREGPTLWTRSNFPIQNTNEVAPSIYELVREAMSGLNRPAGYWLLQIEDRTVGFELSETPTVEGAGGPFLKVAGVKVMYADETQSFVIGSGDGKATVCAAAASRFERLASHFTVSNFAVQASRSAEIVMTPCATERETWEQKDGWLAAAPPESPVFWATDGQRLIGATRRIPADDEVLWKRAIPLFEQVADMEGSGEVRLDLFMGFRRLFALTTATGRLIGSDEEGSVDEHGRLDPARPVEDDEAVPALRLFETLGDRGLRSTGGLFRWEAMEGNRAGEVTKPGEELEPVIAVKVNGAALDGEASAFLATTGSGQVIELVLYEDVADPGSLSRGLRSALAAAIGFGTKRGAEEMIVRARNGAIVAYVIDPLGERLAATWYRTAVTPVSAVELANEEAWPTPPERRYEPWVSEHFFGVLAQDEARPTYVAFGENVVFLCEEKDDSLLIFHLGGFSEAAGKEALLGIETVGAGGGCPEHVAVGETAERALKLARRLGFDIAYRVDVPDRDDATERSWRYLATKEGGKAGWTLYDIEQRSPERQRVCTDFPLRHSAAQAAAEWLARLDGNRCAVVADDERNARVLIATNANKGAIVGAGRREQRDLRCLPVECPGGPPDKAIADSLLRWVGERHDANDGCEVPVRWARRASGGLFAEDGCVGVAGSNAEVEPLVDLICYRGSGSWSEVESPRTGFPAGTRPGRPQSPEGCPPYPSGRQLLEFDDILAAHFLDRLDRVDAEASQDGLRHAWAVKSGTPAQDVVGLAIREPGAAGGEAVPVPFDVITKEGCIATHIAVARNGEDGHVPSMEALAALSGLLTASTRELPLLESDAYLAAAPAARDSAESTPALVFFFPSSASSVDHCEAVLTTSMSPLHERSDSLPPEGFVALIGTQSSPAWRKFNDMPLRPLSLDVYAELLQAVAVGEAIAVEGTAAQAAAVSTPPGMAGLWKEDDHYRYVVLDGDRVRHSLLAGTCKEIPLDRLRTIWKKSCGEACADPNGEDCEPLGRLLYADFDNLLWFKECLTDDPRHRIADGSANCSE